MDVHIHMGLAYSFVWCRQVYPCRVSYTQRGLVFCAVFCGTPHTYIACKCLRHIIGEQMTSQRLVTHCLWSMIVVQVHVYASQTAAVSTFSWNATWFFSFAPAQPILANAAHKSHQGHTTWNTSTKGLLRVLAVVSRGVCTSIPTHLSIVQWYHASHCPKYTILLWKIRHFGYVHVCWW